MLQAEGGAQPDRKRLDKYVSRKHQLKKAPSPLLPDNTDAGAGARQRGWVLAKVNTSAQEEVIRLTLYARSDRAVVTGRKALQK